jgi:hypothetical protein
LKNKYSKPMSHIPDFIYYDDEPTAEPAFRSLIYVAGSMNDDGTRQALTTVFDAFVDTYKDQLWGLIIRDAGVKRTRLSINKTNITAAQKWLATTTKVTAASIRLNAAANERFNAPRIPHLRFEEGDGIVFIEMASPPDAISAVPFANRLMPIIACMPVLCGVMGFGFHMPAGLDSRGFILPAKTLRYRTAIEILLRDPSIGLIRDRSPFRFHLHTNIDTGIADIGWRTLVGSSFLNRLPSLNEVAKIAGIVLENHTNFAIITAGPLPIWGDVETNENIALYCAVAQALKPVAMAREIMLKGYFNGPEGNPEAEQRMDAYRARFE